MNIELEQNQDSVQVSKSSVGFGFIVKSYKKSDEKFFDVVERIKKIHDKLGKEFPNEVRK
jgi:hypothetical protein